MTRESGFPFDARPTQPHVRPTADTRPSAPSTRRLESLGLRPDALRRGSLSDQTAMVTQALIKRLNAHGNGFVVPPSELQFAPIPDTSRGEIFPTNLPGGQDGDPPHVWFESGNPGTAEYAALNTRLDVEGFRQRHGNVGLRLRTRHDVAHRLQNLGPSISKEQQGVLKALLKSLGRYTEDPQLLDEFVTSRRFRI